MPLIFSFGDEDEVVKEKTDHEKKVDELFGDWDSILDEQATDAPAHACNKVTNSVLCSVFLDSTSSKFSLIMVLVEYTQFPVSKFQTEPFSNS